MHVYGSIVSPFVQRVLMVARAKGHHLDLRPPPGGAIQSEEFQAISPMGRIPLLELDDGTRIIESSAISAYLDETLDGPPLLPSEPVQRARVREIEAVATLEYATGMRPIMVHRMFRRPDPGAIVETALAQAAKGADALEMLLDGAGGTVVGDTLTLADCVLVPTLNLGTIIQQPAGIPDLIGERPRLAAYLERMRRDPIAARTITEMTEGFAAMMARNANAT